MPNSKWLDASSQHPTITDRAQKLESFMAAAADGRIDDAELKAQEQRLVKSMQDVEPQLDANLHAKVTELLCELTAFNLMQVMHAIQTAKPKTKFKG